MTKFWVWRNHKQRSLLNSTLRVMKSWWDSLKCQTLHLNKKKQQKLRKLTQIWDQLKTPWALTRGVSLRQARFPKFQFQTCNQSTIFRNPGSSIQNCVSQSQWTTMAFLKSVSLGTACLDKSWAPHVDEVTVAKFGWLKIDSDSSEPLNDIYFEKFEQTLACVSKEHAVIVFDEGHYLLADLGSSNHTWIRV